MSTSCLSASPVGALLLLLPFAALTTPRSSCMVISVTPHLLTLVLVLLDLRRKVFCVLSVVGRAFLEDLLEYWALG